MKITLSIFFIYFSFLSFCQLPKAYFYFTKQADSLYKAKAFEKSALTYNKAFKFVGDKAQPEDHYKAAANWAMANFTDSAFRHLEILITRSAYSNYSKITTDTDLNSLQTDPRWNDLAKLVKDNKDKANEKYNVTLINTIDSMVTEDQKWRGLSRLVYNNEVDTTTFTRKFLLEKMAFTDSMNYHVCKKIVDNYGFPNYTLVGNEASNNFWLLIQHQDMHPGFQDSALAKMKLEVDKKLASGTNYAYLIDRVRLNAKELQIYGTQMHLNAEKTSYEPEPVIDPAQINERRKSVGLNTIEEYTHTMNTRYYGTLKK